MTRTQPAAPPAPLASSILLRRITAILVIILLYTAGVPFAPIVWVIGDIEGALFIDRLLAGVAFICALYFQFAFAGVKYPITVVLPSLGGEGSNSYISNGRMTGSRARSEASADFAFYYHPSSYWICMAAEIGLLLVAEFGGLEYLRRVIVCGVVAALWAVGWTITPRSTKMWAWEHIKTIWLLSVWELMYNIGLGGGRQRRRR